MHGVDAVVVPGQGILGDQDQSLDDPLLLQRPQPAKVGRSNLGAGLDLDGQIRTDNEVQLLNKTYS